MIATLGRDAAGRELLACARGSLRHAMSASAIIIRPDRSAAISSPHAASHRRSLGEREERPLEAVERDLRELIEREAEMLGAHARTRRSASCRS